MAVCNVCGRDAGYLLSICESCKKARQETGETVSAPKAGMYRSDLVDVSQDSGRVEDVIPNTLAWVGIIFGWGLARAIMEKGLGIGGAIPNMILALPFLIGARAVYRSRGGKLALLLVLAAFSVLVAVVLLSR